MALSTRDLVAARHNEKVSAGIFHTLCFQPPFSSITLSSINPSPYLAMTKSTQLTPVQASSTYIQMSGERGLRKENTPGLVPFGLRYRMLMPKVMKGLEKSMTFSLT